VAVAGGERLTAAMAAGGLICLAAIAAVSMPATGPEDQNIMSTNGPGARPAATRLRGLGYGAAAGAAFGLFFLCLRNAGESGVLWPVAVSRGAGSVVALAIALAAGIRPWRRIGDGSGTSQRAARGIALASGAVDAAANVCYVLATRAGLFGLAVVITALYPGMTVLLARWVLGERMRWLQRAGLLLAAVGVVLLTL
jgi:drug/metabolite transporter (DMT)-like permease